MPPTQATPADEADSVQDVELAEAADLRDDTTSPSPTETISEAIAAEVAEISEEDFERAAGELRGEPEAAAGDTEPGIEVASAPEETARPAALGRADASGPAGPDSQDAHAIEGETAPEPERRAPRGRFERFYAPGQGPRAEHNGQNGHGSHVVPAPPAASATRRPLRDAVTAYESLAADDDDDEVVAPSGPREDVRGSVGELIDSLHDLFAHDRTVASQGGVARCGICYFHFPINDLIYREADGFYVCHNCERSLGVGRVPMVRRQQRL